MEEKNVTLLAYLLSKSINEQGGIFRLLLEKLRAWWKDLSKHALLLGTSEYSKMTTVLFINSKAESSSKIIGHDYKKQRALKLCFLIENKLSESFE